MKYTVIFMIHHIFILYHQQNCCQYHEYSTSYSPNAHSCYILTKCLLKAKHSQTAVMSSKNHTVDVCVCVCFVRPNCFSFPLGYRGHNYPPLIPPSVLTIRHISPSFCSFLQNEPLKQYVCKMKCVCSLISGYMHDR